MQRIRHFFNTVGTNWSEQPAARGAAKMAAGAVLVAEGLFGVISNRVRRRGRRGKNGSSNRGGLFGGIMTLIIGGVFMVVGLVFLAPDIPDDERTTTGTIVEVEQGTNSEGETRFSPVYAYEVDGQEYRLHSSVSSSSRPTIGDTVEIGYSASDPNNARRIGGIEGNIHWIFFGAGAFVFLTGVFHVLISLLLIGFGIKLIRDGRRDRAEAGDEKQGFFSDMFSLARRASSGELDVSTTAAGNAGSSPGQPDQAFRALIGATTAGVAGVGSPAGQAQPHGQPEPVHPPEQAAPAPAGPPAGWYAAPDGSGNQQWWDGTGWTHHTAPPNA
jgi:hypothetical protein